MWIGQSFTSPYFMLNPVLITREMAATVLIARTEILAAVATVSRSPALFH